jgi:hypothetical protein
MLVIHQSLQRPYLLDTHLADALNLPNHQPQFASITTKAHTPKENTDCDSERRRIMETRLAARETC